MKVGDGFSSDRCAREHSSGRSALRRSSPASPEQSIWRKSHEQFTASVKGAKLIVAEKGDHMIPFRQPDLLVSVVSEVVRPAK
jgi:hypothetical protein